MTVRSSRLRLVKHSWLSRVLCDDRIYGRTVPALSRSNIHVKSDDCIVCLSAVPLSTIEQMYMDGVPQGQYGAAFINLGNLSCQVGAD